MSTTVAAQLLRSCAPCRLTRVAGAQRWRLREGLRNRSAPRLQTASCGRSLSTYPGSTQVEIASIQVEALEDVIKSLDEASLEFDLSPALRSHSTLAESRTDTQSAEAVAREARQQYGNVLPTGFLTEEQLRVYVRLYGEPERVDDPQELDEDGQLSAPGALNGEERLGIQRASKDGIFEDVEYHDEADAEAHAQEEDGTEGEDDPGDVTNSPELRKLRKSKLGRFFAMATKKELDEQVLYAQMTTSDEHDMKHVNKIWTTLAEAEQLMYLADVRYLKLEHWLRDNDKDVEADELLQCLFIHFEADLQRTQGAAQADTVEMSTEVDNPADDQAEEESDTLEDDTPFQRTHPLTLTNRFGVPSSTVLLPKDTLVNVVSTLLSRTSPVHLQDAAHRIFGGPGLPYSTSNPQFAQSLPQKAIPLDPSQGEMADIDVEAYLAAVMPGTYASIMSVLIETRKRLGADWLEGLMAKEGGPRILDAGGAGAGVFAFREVLRAEWERTMDNSDDPDAITGVALPTGLEGGAPIKAPIGKATVLTGSSSLRKRASLLLEDTTFVPRLPDYMHASDPKAAQQGKFDIIFAPHTLWSLKENWLRKQQVANLWSLLNSDGGVLILIEKGVPRGFEVIAGARKFLLDTRVASPGNELVSEEVNEPEQETVIGRREKGKGMIIAPCTNHSDCPMYTRPGITPGRADYCHFSQRFIRPSYLQKLVHAKDKNHEDVRFSYLSIMRGRDLRAADEQGLVQGDVATARAFTGFEHDADGDDAEFDPTASILEDPALETLDRVSAGPHSLALPRTIMPPLKRTGHVLLDLCTPSGTLERWTVPRSFSRQAFRDARKSSWGDLWALGAKTRTTKNVRLGRDASSAASQSINLKNVTLNKKARKTLAEQPAIKARGKGRKQVYEVPVEPGRTVTEMPAVRTVNSGRMRHSRISGIRDKRDKKGTGHGRRKSKNEE